MIEPLPRGPYIGSEFVQPYGPSLLIEHRFFEPIEGTGGMCIAVETIAIQQGRFRCGGCDVEDWWQCVGSHPIHPMPMSTYRHVCRVWAKQQPIEVQKELGLDLMMEDS